MIRRLQPLVTAAAVALAVLLAVHAPDSGAACAQEALPPGVVARVYGRDIRESELLDRLARTYEGTERGRGVLDLMVEDMCVAHEAKRRNVTVTEAEIREYMRRWDERIRKQSKGKASLADLYEPGKGEREFLDTAREYLKRQKMAREDLGARGTADLPEHRLKLWVAALRRRLKVRFTDLPPGALAVVGGATIDRAAFARKLEEKLPAELVATVRSELVLVAVADRRLREAAITVGDEELDAALGELRERFAADPQVRGTGITFDQFLRQTRGIGEAELRSDPVFRTRIGLRQLLEREISEEDVRSHWLANRLAYGERVMVRQVFFAAAEKGNEFDLPTFREAWERALQAKVDVIEATGMHLPEPDRPDAELGPIVTRVAKRFERNEEKRKRAGEPVVWTRLSVENEPTIEKAVFEGPTRVLQGPIKSSVGYHLLVVEERRPAPKFDEVKGRIREDLLSKAVHDFQLRAREDPNVIVAE